MSHFTASGRRPRIAGAAAAAVVALALSACSSSTPTVTSTTSSTTSAGTTTSSGTSSSDTASATSSGTSSSAPNLTTGTGNGVIDQAEYDSVIAGGPKADAAAVDASAWAKKIKDRGVLNTGGTDAGQLFSLLDPATGKLTGFDAGLAQLLSQYILGSPNINLTVTTVDTRETLIQNGTVDTVFATYSITPARAQKVAFAGPYFISGAAIMVKADNTDITKVEDLAGKNVATETNSTSATALQDKVPTAVLQLYADDAACQAAVQQGRADAYVLDQSILISDAIANPAVKVVGEPFTVDPYGIGVTLDDPAAKAFVNTWLQKIYDDGTWAKLWKATIGTVVSGDAPTPPKIGSVEGS